MKKMLLIVGLLVLSVLVVSCAREGAVAGEATKIGASKVSCDDVKKCGLGSNLIFKSFGEISTFYGDRNTWLTKTGAEICRDIGYSGCMMAESHNQIQYFSSTDGTCMGVQVAEENNKLESCSWEPSAPISCVPSYSSGPPLAGRDPNIEPSFGDQWIVYELMSVVCAR